MTFSNKAYDVLKYVAQIVLPALATLYAVLAGLWDLPRPDAVVGTIVALDTFLGVLLQLSSSSFNKSDAKFDGNINVVGLADGAKQQIGSGVVAFVAVSEGKASIVAGVTDDLTARISAVDLVRVAAEALGGKGGGGRPDMAQAGGPDNGDAKVALDAIRKKLGELTPA